MTRGDQGDRVKIYRSLRRFDQECPCHDPGAARVVARTLAERVAPLRGLRESSTRGSGAARGSASVVRESVAPQRPSEVDPVILSAGPGSACRPFLKVEKDPHKFAACNALADTIGPLNTPKKAFKLIGEAIGDEVNEVFGIVTLDLHLRMKSIAETGRGEPAAVMAPMVPTIQAALIDGAHAVILFHCHPSGVEAQPSPADKETTKAFEDAFEVVNVHLLDHVITGGDIKKRSYFSFAEEGLLAT